MHFETTADFRQLRVQFGGNRYRHGGGWDDYCPKPIIWGKVWRLVSIDTHVTVEDKKLDRFQGTVMHLDDEGLWIASDFIDWIRPLAPYMRAIQWWTNSDHVVFTFWMREPMEFDKVIDILEHMYDEDRKDQS